MKEEEKSLEVREKAARKLRVKMGNGRDQQEE
jgi:hypothetical protein